MSARIRVSAALSAAGLVCALVWGASPAFAATAEDAASEFVIGTVVSAQPRLVAETGVIVTDVEVVQAAPGGGVEVAGFAMRGGEIGDMGMWSEQYVALSPGDPVLAPVEEIGGAVTAVGAPVSGVAAVSAGYIWEGLSWPDSSLPVHYRFNPSGMPTGSESAVIASADAWENDAGSYMDYTYDGTTSTSAGAADGVNVVGTGALGAGGPLAVCQYWYNPSTMSIVQFDIQFNVSNYSFATNGSGSAYDVRAVGTHEFGHTLCLSDMYEAENANQVMYGYVTAGDLSSRTLKWGDIAGIRAIYPSPAGSLSGTVTDAVGTGLSGASVSVPGSPAVLTGASGTYAISGIEPGAYDVTYSKPGYISRTLSVTIADDGNTVSNVALSAPPATTASVSPSTALSSWIATSATVSLSASASTGTIAWTHYAVNGGAEQAYATPFVISGEGTTTIGYRSQDSHGNLETSKTAAVRIDLSAPVTTLVRPGATYAAGAGGCLSLVASDALSGVATTSWRLGASGGFKSGTAVPVPAAVGTYTIQYFSVDAVGNAEAVQSSQFAVISDALPPVTTSDAKAQYDTSARVSLTATDLVSGVASTHWLLDGIAGTGTTIDVAAYGNHSLSFWSIDGVGNAETPSAVSFFVRDVTAPTVSAFVDALNTENATIELRASDEAHGSGVASISYRLDDEATQTVAGAYTTVTPSQGVTHTVTYWANDVAGNASSPGSVTRKVIGPTRFLLDTLPSPVAPGAFVTLSARVETFSAVAPVAGESVILQVSNGGVWSKAVPTGALVAEDGSFTFEFSPLQSATYRFSTSPGTALRYGVSDPFVIGVRALVTRPSAPKSPMAKRTFSVSGRVTPKLASTARLKWYRVKSTGKKYYAGKTVSLSSTGKWTAKRSLPRGTWAARVVYTDPFGVVTTSSYRTFKVR